MFIKNGIYNGKELCELFGIDNNKFKNNTQTYVNKIKQYCTLEEKGRGRGKKYIISNAPLEDISINFNTRIDKGTERGSCMGNLYQQSIMYYLLNSKEGISFATFDNWLVNMGLVEIEFKNKNQEYQNMSLNDEMEIDFFKHELPSIRYNFLKALDNLEKAREIKYWKLLIFVTTDIRKKEFHRVASEKELDRYVEIINNINKKYNISSRYDLLFSKGKRKELKCYDREVKTMLTTEFNCDRVYTAYKIYLFNTHRIEQYKDKYLSDFNLIFAKDSIYNKRLECANTRQQKIIEEKENKKDKIAFGVIAPFIDTDDEVFVKKWNSEYLEEWKKLYKKYIHGEISM